MAIEQPLWMQNLKYAARLDRRMIERLLGGTERVFDGLAVTQNGTGNFTIDVSAGGAAVLGDDTAEQGMYVVEITATETVAVPSSPPSGSRTDSVVLRINDAQAGGAAGDDATLEVIEGGSAIPASAIVLATIDRSAAEGSILDSAITDVRPLGRFPYTVSDSPPPAGAGADGDLWVQVV